MLTKIAPTNNVGLLNWSIAGLPAVVNALAILKSMLETVEPEEAHHKTGNICYSDNGPSLKATAVYNAVA